VRVVAGAASGGAELVVALWPDGRFATAVLVVTTQLLSAPLREGRKPRGAGVGLVALRRAGLR
jgi:hypothetical protein